MLRLHVPWTTPALTRRTHVARLWPAALLLCACGMAPAAEPGNELRKLSQHEYQLGLVRIDKSKREVRLPGKVNMTEGLVELFLCTSSGKTHESVFVTEAKPIHVQTALLLLGARAGKCPNEKGADDVPEGDRIVVLVQIKDKEPVRAEQFVWHQTAKQAMEQTTWVFTGSKIIEGQYMADVEGSLVATWYDPLAIVNNPLPTNADDELYVVNTKAAPAQGSPVTIVFRLEKTRDEKP